MKKNNDWFAIQNPDEIDSPALIFYESRMKENIIMLKSMINDPLRLRPHVKTHKTKEAAILMMEAGILNFKCATISEAEMLGASFAPDVLLAYQPVGPKLQRFVSLIKEFPTTQFSCLVDNEVTAIEISKAALEAGLVIRVYIDLNVGMNRTGITPGKKAIQLYEFCASRNGIIPVGLHFYDGHVRDKDINKRQLVANEILAEVRMIKATLQKSGYDNIKIVGGGSPTFPIYAATDDIVCSPGTFILWDWGYHQALPEQEFLFAAVVITRVISLPAERKICLDLGYKAIASENALIDRIHFLNAHNLEIVSQSEEHLVVETPGEHEWKVGDLLYALPIHICPTCALYESAAIVREGKLAGSWKIIARDRKINY